MIVLLLGAGGREHALAWKMAQSAQVKEIIVVPGSDGIAALDKVTCRAGKMTDAAAMVDLAREIGPAFIVVGPEAPMEVGVVDALEDAGFGVVGPRQVQAQLETSKIYSKDFMREAGIRTARYISCEGYDAAMTALRDWDIAGRGVVIKADGLAAGKGVVVTDDRAEAEETLYDFMKNPACTVKAARVVLEEKVYGKEVSFFALCDGVSFVNLGYACDYKRVNDGNCGPNTGGMGGYVPVGWPSDAVKAFVNTHVFQKVVDGMAARGVPYRGILYAGLMVDGDDVNVIEFNARFGDPEAQVLMPAIESDIVPLFAAAAKGQLAKAAPVVMRAGTSVHVVMVSGGYPDTMGEGMKTGAAITLPDSMNDNTHLFIAGAEKRDGKWVNTGGRVLGVTALGADVDEARRRAYRAIDAIHFDGAHWRTDIGT